MQLMTQVVRRQQNRLKEEVGVAEARTRALQAGLVRKASHSPNSAKAKSRVTSAAGSRSRSRVTSGAASPVTPAQTPSVPPLKKSPRGAESPVTPAPSPSVPPSGLTWHQAAAINAQVAANVPVASGSTIADLAAPEPPPPMTLRSDITADIAEALLEVKRLLRSRADSGHNDRTGQDVA